MPGITITGRFPVRMRASAKIRSRLGVRFAEIQAAEGKRKRRNKAGRMTIQIRQVSSVSFELWSAIGDKMIPVFQAKKIVSKLLFGVASLTAGIFESGTLRGGRCFPSSVNQGCHEASAKSIVNIYD